MSKDDTNLPPSTEIDEILRADFLKAVFNILEDDATPEILKSIFLDVLDSHGNLLVN